MASPPPAEAAQPTLTSLDPLPQEIESLVLDAYILSTPLSSRSYQDILCLDHRTHNRAVVRLYHKVTLHADNGRKFYLGLEDIVPDLKRYHEGKRSGDEGQRRRAEESNVLLTGYVDYSNSRTVRYPKHFLLRRVRQITFLHPWPLARTGEAIAFFHRYIIRLGNISFGKHSI
ncbi:hypothetical protein IAT38_005464 [Cryptococcus sp. DSM 104549]